MAHLTLALNEVRDHVAGELDEIVYGDDGTEDSVNDSGILGNEILSHTEGGSEGDYTEETPDDSVLRVTDTVGLSEGNGSTFREVVLRRTSDIGAFIRIAHSDQEKQNDFELRYSVTLRWRNP